MSAEPIWKAPSGPMKDDQRIAAIRKLLDGASPQVRRAAISAALHADLEQARRTYAKVYEAEEKYKAHLIGLNGRNVREAADRLADVFDTGAALLELASILVRVAVETETREGVLALAMGQLGAVCGPWKDGTRGLERGAGISGYDSADGVARIRADAASLHQRWLDKQGKPAR